MCKEVAHTISASTSSCYRRSFAAEILTPVLRNINLEVTDNFDTCNIFKRIPSRPVVALPLGRKFNDVVAMDLKV